jgi:regulator of cell morphogenesis and NO signaling
MDTSIQQIVRERPWMGRIFTAYGLDSASPAPPPNQPELQLHLRQVWNGPEGLKRLHLTELLDYIVHCHHRYMRKVLPQLIQQARANPVQTALQAILKEGNPHMFREEMEVFPAIRDTHSENRRPPHLIHWIQRLEQEHTRSLQHFLELRRAMPQASAQLQAALTDLNEDMRWHMYAENELLFPRVLRCA